MFTIDLTPTPDGIQATEKILQVEHRLAEKNISTAERLQDLLDRVVGGITFQHESDQEYDAVETTTLSQNQIQVMQKALETYLEAEYSRSESLKEGLEECKRCLSGRKKAAL